MAFHFKTKEEARAAIRDAAFLLLEADMVLSLPITEPTIKELSKLCRMIENGYKISRSPLLGC